MKIKEKIEDHVAVLTLSGKMMGGPETTALHDHVKGLIRDGVKKVVIDLGDVKWMNSSGMGVLMACMTTLNNAEGKLVLARVSEKVYSLLMITQLIKVFESFETTERAVAALTN
ncbi:MAG: STAS domain-containing protein [Calditrichaceae bacterium]|nr:STAS domain-containing protein [Calditrichaceae bacterium]MBN2707784.1 STAS domain-containing protein [Calditrichaceae bacterium]RQV96290.1 MAG: anti-sigma factor antagonist [Calditrichota bacterium]